MGNCFPVQEVVALEDEQLPGSKRINVTLTSGMVVPVVVIPSDSMRDINHKIVQVYGKQPKVHFKGEMVEPFLNLQQGKGLVPIKWEATIDDVGATKLKYSAITDRLDDLKMLSNTHWALFNSTALMENIKRAAQS